MIGMARQDRGGAIKLFRQKHTHQLVGKRHRAEPQAPVDAREKSRIEPVGPADHERQIPAFVATARDKACEILGRQVATAFVESDRRTTGRKLPADQPCFLGPAIFGAPRAALLDFRRIGHRQSDRATRGADTLDEPIDEITLGAGLQPPDRDN